MRASKSKLRVSTQLGVVCVEDLWDMQLANLNNTAVKLSKMIKEAGEEDFLDESVKVDPVLQLSFDVVFEILTIKKDEKTARALATVKRETKQKLLGILADKEDESLKGKSAKQIQKMLDAL